MLARCIAERGVAYRLAHPQVNSPRVGSSCTHVLVSFRILLECRIPKFARLRSAAWQGGNTWQPTVDCAGGSVCGELPK
jgi:hypothetical protein